MKAIFSSLFILAATISATQAYTKLTLHRIFASDLIDFRVNEIEIESPASITLMLGRDDFVDNEVIIESDDFLEDCATALETLIASGIGYVEILVHENADTMNGIMVLHCTHFSDTPIGN